MAQNDFSNTTIKNTGCTFLSVLAAIQIIANRVFTEDEINQIWNTAIIQDTKLMKNGTLIDGKVIDQSDATVNNPDDLCNIALSQIGIDDVGMSFGWDKSGGEGIVVGKRAYGDTPVGGKHYILQDSNSHLIWDPWDPDLVLKNIKGVKIYVYEK